MKRCKFIGDIILGALIGLFIGIACETVYSSIFGGLRHYPGVPGFLEQFHNENVAVAVERILYLFYGALCALAGRVYHRPERSLWFRSALHLLCVAAGALVVGGYLHWYAHVNELAGFFGVFVLVYMLIWVIIYLWEKKKIKQINQRISAAQTGR